MKSMKTLTALVPFIAALFLLACGPSNEGEPKTWDKNQKKVAELSAEYPNFKTALAAEEAKAKTAMEAAKKEGNEEAKATKMKAANEIVGKLVSRISEVKYKIEGLEKTIGKLGKLKLAGVQADARKANMASARAAVNKAKEAFSKATPADGAAAMAALKPIVGDLISAQATAKRKLKALSPKKARKKKAKKDKKK